MVGQMVRAPVHFYSHLSEVKYKSEPVYGCCRVSRLQSPGHSQMQIFTRSVLSVDCSRASRFQSLEIVTVIKNRLCGTQNKLISDHSPSADIVVYRC